MYLKHRDSFAKENKRIGALHSNDRTFAEKTERNRLIFAFRFLCLQSRDRRLLPFGFPILKIFLSGLMEKG